MVATDKADKTINGLNRSIFRKDNEPQRTNFIYM